MELIIFTAVLGSAFLHAFWNFLIKGHNDKVLAMMAVAAGHVPFALAGLLITGLPPIEATKYILCSAVLHTGYMIFLMNAYRFGALSNIYPIAKGLSPLLLILLTLIIGQDMLQVNEIMGVGLVALALIGFGLFQYKYETDGLTGLLLAITTGFFIASYSMVDALGTRIAGNSFAYYGTMSLLNTLMMLVYISLGHKGVMARVMREGQQSFWLGGGASYLAYDIVLWACIHAPIAVVSSLRETSVLIAMLLGVFLLKEKFSMIKIGAALVVLAGLVLIRLG